MSNPATMPGYKRHQLIGSTYILGNGKDRDTLVLVENAVAARAALMAEGWHCESDTSEQYNDALFYSLRLGEKNALITADDEYFDRFVTAAEVCKYIFQCDPSPQSVVRDRSFRVMVHKIVRDGHRL